MAKDWRVVFQTGEKAGRKLFSGNEKDTRTYVEQHFPRTHSDENHDPDVVVHDVKVVSPDGSEEVYHVDHGWSPKPEYYAQDSAPSEVYDQQGSEDE